MGFIATIRWTSTEEDTAEAAEEVGLEAYTALCSAGFCDAEVEIEELP